MRSRTLGKTDIVISAASAAVTEGAYQPHMYSAVIFDFNGTLFWDTAMHNEAWDIFLEEYDMHLEDHVKHEKMHGKNNREILRTVFDPDIGDDEADALSWEKERIYREVAERRGMELADGAVELFEDLQSGGTPFTIATASEKVNLDFYFERFSLGRWFDRAQIIYNDLSMPSKPDPTMYLRAIESIGTPAEKTVIFEDSIAGIGSAQNAGAGKVVVVNSNDENYPDMGLQIIRSYHEVDRAIFS